MGRTTVGVVANPASARDVRRLVALGGTMTTHDKLNRLQRLLVGLAGGGVERVLAMPDRSGITVGLRRLAARPSAASWPELEFIEQPVGGTAADTRRATEAMVAAGVGAIVVLGGDGTNRIVAGASGDVPLVSISTGTNNAFPLPVESTVAGLAAGLVARDDGCRRAGTHRAKQLVVRHGSRVERALVDVAISDGDRVGSGAVWDGGTIRELYLCFAEPDAIGLSAIGGHLHPIGRREPGGLAVAMGEPVVATIHPPIGPGLVQPIGVRSIDVLVPDTPVEVRAASGVVAIDGERLFRFGSDDRPTITLRPDGPVVVSAASVLTHASTTGLLATPAARATTATAPASHDPTDPPPEGNHHDDARSARSVHRDGPHPAVRVPDPAGVPR
ncbi:MAG: NAD(+)/NADH kinase [Actinomycetota bacterium]